ncbi:MAG: hypothetical protein ACRCZE_03105 [Candidatus Altimarinota bacterium]
MKKSLLRSTNLDSPREVLRTRLYELEKILQSDLADRFCRDALNMKSSEVRQRIADLLLPLEIGKDKHVDKLVDEDKIDDSINRNLSYETIAETSNLAESYVKKIQLRPDYREALSSYRFDNQNLLKEFLPGLGFRRLDHLIPEESVYFASLLSTEFWDDVHQDIPDLIRANLRRKLAELYSGDQIVLPTTPDQMLSLPGLDPVICSAHPLNTPGILAVPFAVDPNYPIWTTESAIPEAGQQIISSRFKVSLNKGFPLFLKDASAYYGTENRFTVYRGLEASDFARLFQGIQKVLTDQAIPYKILKAK